VGGLPRWPIKLALPLGFALLTLQGISELIKRIAYLTGHLQLVEEEREVVE
jgi:TRAP-type mannitol/chloroaromatic compound transport system permease small subunit